MTEGIGFHTGPAENYADFSKALEKNIAALDKNIHDSGSVSHALGEIKQFFEVNQQYLNQTPRTEIIKLVQKCRTIEKSVLGEDPVTKQIVEIANKKFNAAQETPNQPPTIPIGRALKAGTAVDIPPSEKSTQRTKIRVESPEVSVTLAPKDKYVSGQKIASITTKVEQPDLYYKINVKGMDGSPDGNSYLVTKKHLRKAGEATVFRATLNDGEQVAIRRVNLNPTPDEIREGAPEQPLLDVKHTAVFEGAMKNTNDPRMSKLCLKTEVLFKYDSNNLPTVAYEIMPLAKMSVDKLSKGELKNAFLNLPSEQKSKAVQYVAHQLLEGLAFVHEQEWVHHDVKLDNLLLMDDGSIKLTDFGFTKRFNEPSKMKSEQLNPQFISPELAKNKIVEGTTDMWSTGLLICELCGVVIPKIGLGNLREESEAKKLTGKLLEQLKEKSPEMVDLVSKMLTYDSNTRISAADALKHPMFNEPMTKEDFSQLINNLETK